MRRGLPVLSLLAMLGCARDADPPPGWRLVSLNAWGVPFSEALDERFRRLPAALLELEPDVICLQEVWLSTKRERLRAALAPRFRVTAAEGGGLLLASRFPIREESFVAFPAFEGLSLVERLAGKGWLEAVLRTPSGDVRVVTTHLALDGPRHLQLGHLARHLEGRRDLPLVLAGDLNTATADDSFRRLLDAGFRDARAARRRSPGDSEEGPPTRVGWPRTGSSRGWRPDHVLLRGLRAGVWRLALDTPRTALSDHNLLLVDVAPAD